MDSIKDMSGRFFEIKDKPLATADSDIKRASAEFYVFLINSGRTIGRIGNASSHVTGSLRFF